MVTLPSILTAVDIGYHSSEVAQKTRGFHGSFFFLNEGPALFIDNHAPYMLSIRTVYVSTYDDCVRTSIERKTGVLLIFV